MSRCPVWPGVFALPSVRLVRRAPARRAPRGLPRPSLRVWVRASVVGVCSSRVSSGGFLSSSRGGCAWRFPPFACQGCASPWRVSRVPGLWLRSEFVPPRCGELRAQPRPVRSHRVRETVKAFMKCHAVTIYNGLSDSYRGYGWVFVPRIACVFDHRAIDAHYLRSVKGKLCPRAYVLCC